MVAGLNLEVRVWKIAFQPDDDVGGAVTSGSVYYPNFPARLQAVPPNQILLQQGLETQRVFIMVCRPTFLIYERDEIEITKPETHQYFGERFRVAGVTISNFHPADARGYLILSLIHSERAHVAQ